MDFDGEYSSKDDTDQVAEPTSRRRPRWPWAVVGVFLLMIGLTVAAWNVTLPYFAMSPGPLYDVTDFVILGEGDVHQSEGDLYMLTVVLQEVNIFEYALGSLDPAVDLVERQKIRADDVTRSFPRIVLPRIAEGHRRL